MRPLYVLAAAAILGCGLPAGASAADLSTTLSAPSAKARACTSQTSGAGTAHRTWTSPGLGLATARLRGGRRGDWDLALFDRRSRRLLGSSAAFGANELARTLVTKGQQVVVQACRRSGASRVPLRLEFAAVSPRPAEKLSLVEVSARTPFDFYRLRSLGLDLTDHSDGSGQDVVLHGSGDAAKLTQAGFTYRVKIADLGAQDRADREREESMRARGARAAAVAPTPGGRTTYRTLAEYEADLKKMVTGYRNLARPITLPVKTLEGRDIVGVELASDVNRADDGRPVFVIMGLHHAREWPSGEATIEFALDLLQGYGRNPRFTRILDRTRVLVIPVVNADGFDASRLTGYNPTDNQPSNVTLAPAILGGGAGAYRRKNCRALTPGDGAVPCPARTTGVDPNRNYGELWGGPGASTDFSAQDFRGAGPFSEPETESVRRFVRNKQVTVLVTNHTFTGLILRPPGLAFRGPTPDEDRMKALGDAMGAQTDYVSQYGYQLYDTSGTTDDWVYNGLNAYSYTPEIGKVNFHPAYEEFQAEYDGRTTQPKDGQPAQKLGGLREAFTLAAEAAYDANQHSVIRGTAPAGLKLQITRDFETQTSPLAPDSTAEAPKSQPVRKLPESRTSTLTVPRDGTFEWHVSPSTRPYETTPVPWKLTCQNDRGSVVERRDVFVERGQRVTLDLPCGGASSRTCVDRQAPTSTIRRGSLRASRRALSLSGRATDRGCGFRGAGEVRRVFVAVFRPRFGACQFLLRTGELSGRRSCRRPVLLRATGTARWRFAKRVRLPAATYGVRAVAVDSRRNTERGRHASRRASFRIR
jgi:hypothetical protein